MLSRMQIDLDGMIGLIKLQDFTVRMQVIAYIRLILHLGILCHGVSRVVPNHDDKLDLITFRMTN